jgi:hypothetical protein
MKNRAEIGAEHVRTDTAHTDKSDTLWLDGKATKPAGWVVRESLA